jgi:hypothetical protein
LKANQSCNERTLLIVDVDLTRRQLSDERYAGTFNLALDESFKTGINAAVWPPNAMKVPDIRKIDRHAQERLRSPSHVTEKMFLFAL